MRHGPTAATVVTAIQDVEESKRFQATIRADCQPSSMIERELIARLASLQWWLRRTTIKSNAKF